MFKVPEWGEDIPKDNIQLKKKLAKRQKEHNVTPSSPKLTNNASTTNSSSSPKKRKLNGQIVNNKKKKCNDKMDELSMDSDKFDEVLLNAKKNKFYEPMRRDDVEHLLFKEDTKTTQEPVTLSSTGKQLAKIIEKHSQKNKKVKNKNNKTKSAPEPENDIKKVFQIKNNDINGNSVPKAPINKKKEALKQMLKTHNRNTITVTGNKLRQRMLERLKAAQFRYLNEKLYTSSGTEAKQLFQSDPAAFHTYHQGYQQQLKKWPVNPLDVIAKRIQKMPKTHTIADMGCGEAALSKRIPQEVRSFDLVCTAPGVEICDMAHTPLLAASMDVAVYCLALMGTDLTQYLLEANRILKMGGYLLIAEVESRFDDVDAFSKEVTRLGFKLKNLDKKHKVFFFLEFIKIAGPPVKKSRLPVLTLKPCLYKRR